MLKKANSDLVRRQNRGLVLETLRHHGPLARITLGHKTGLSPASITSISAQLIDEGLVHSIGRPEPGVTNAWIDKYIFPGGYSPSLSEVLPAIEKAGLIVTDVEILRLHYAETIRHWRERFEAVRPEIVELYDERFCRMWEFYLGIAEQSFRARRQFIWQIQLAKKVEAVPITRDYIRDAEHAMASPRRQVA